MSSNSSHQQQEDEAREHGRRSGRRGSIGSSLAKGAKNKLGLREKGGSSGGGTGGEEPNNITAKPSQARIPRRLSDMSLEDMDDDDDGGEGKGGNMSKAPSAPTLNDHSKKQHRRKRSTSPKRHSTMSLDFGRSGTDESAATSSSGSTPTNVKKGGRNFFMRKTASAAADPSLKGMAGGSAAATSSLLNRPSATSTSSKDSEVERRSSGMSLARKHQSVMTALIDKTSSAPGNMVKGFSNVVVGAGTAVKTTTQKASNKFVDAGTAVGNTVVGAGTKGFNTVAYGGKALVDGTTNTTKVFVGGSTAFINKGARGFANTIKAPLQFAPAGLFGLQKKTKSKWEEGIEVIDELLDPASDVYEVMTEDQRQRLSSVKKFLLKGPNGRNDSVMHIPRELIQMRTMKDDDIDMGYEDMEDLNNGNRNGSAKVDRRTSSKNMKRNSTFILQEYAGVKNAAALAGSVIDDDDFYDAKSGEEKEDKHSPSDGQTVSTADVSDTLSAAESIIVTKYYVPPEFAAISAENQKELFEMLSWDSIGKWNFDIFRLNEITNGHPLLFMGWAIIGSPYAHQAMAKELGLDFESLNGDNSSGDGSSNTNTNKKYTFMDEFKIPPEKFCNYVRTIEEDYCAENPYHNAIHAADVLQSLHALLQNSLEEEFMKDCPQINLFAILLAAIVHDVDHPGKTNGFHVQLKSELAVMYNDRSVLENWHVAHAFARMFDLDLTHSESIHANQVSILGAKNDQSSPNNILCNTTPEQFTSIRKHMIEAVLHTDMTNHFESVNAARGMIRDDEGLDHDERMWKMLMFMLHLADISGQAKGGELFLLWTNRCMEEFFQQGDEETKLGLPISPNCDRKTVIPADSQVGFIQFVIEPAYDVLGMYIPFVQATILPQIHSNHEYWSHQGDQTEASIPEGDEEEGVEVVEATPLQ